MEIHNAWAVLFISTGRWAVAGPFATSEEAHQYSVPRGGVVVFNCENDHEAIMVAKRAFREKAQEDRLGTDLELTAGGRKGWRGCLN